LKEKKEIYSHSNIRIVTPSAWLFNLAVQSPLFEGKKIYHINNGVDVDRYCPLGKEAIRNEFHIPADARVIFFSSEKISSGTFKGGKLLLDILASLNQKTKQKIHVVMIGKGSPDEIGRMENFVLHPMGYVFDENVIIKLINASDVLLYPSKADNLPNVLIESISCGVPAVTFDVGGCKEIIRNNENGFVLEPFETHVFAEKVLDLMNNDSMRKSFSLAARNIAVSEFSLSAMAGKYYEILKETVSGG
jgi:glycosyltransferase involved in cell wall biosynthesis